MERAALLTGRRARLVSEAYGSAVTDHGNRPRLNDGMSQREHGGGDGAGSGNHVALRGIFQRDSREGDFLLRGE
jgi:hypothetical protein